MATAREDTVISGTLTWVMELIRVFIAGAIMWGVFVSVSSSLAFLIVPQLFPAAQPFLWLAVVGAVISFLDPRLTEEEVDLFAGLVEDVSEMSTSEKFIYGGTIGFVAVGMMSLLITVVGVGSMFIAQTWGLWFLGMFAAVIYPPIDQWLGRNLGANIATVGAILALGLMMAIARLYRVSPSVPQEAAANIRHSLAGR